MVDIFNVKLDMGDGGCREFRLPKGEHTIGPASDCSIQIPTGAETGEIKRVLLNSDGFALLDGAAGATDPNGETDATRTIQQFSDAIRVGSLILTIDRVNGDEDLEQRLAAITPGGSTIYEIRDEIARGGMGNVIEAKESSLGRIVAMKVQHAKGDESPTARRRFLREATVLARLEHPNIVPIHDFGRDAAGKLFYTMKLVKGETLGEIIRRLRRSDSGTLAQFPLDRLLNDFRKVCDAIAFAHSRGVIHRDLKPENIMLGEFGEVLVMDWGLAKILSEPDPDESEATGNVASIEGFTDFSESELGDLRASLTMAGTVVGTPQFMPPEQSEGRIKDIDARSDVFALGGILYSLLTLRPPATGRTVGEIFGKIRAGEIIPPTHYNLSGINAAEVPEPSPKDDLARSDPKNFRLAHLPGQKVPTALSAVAMRALSVEPDDRHSSARELQQDVVAYQGGFSTSAEDVGALGQLMLLIKRHRIISGAGLLIVVLTLAFITQLVRSQQEAVASKALAIAESTNARAAEETAQRKEAETRQALAASQITLAEAALREENGIGIRQALELSPDGMRTSHWNYLWGRQDDSVHSFSVTANGLQPQIDPLSPERFFIHRPAGEVQLIDHDSQPLRTFATDVRGEAVLAVSGDGSTVAVATAIPRFCKLIDAESGKLRATCDLLRADKRSRVTQLEFSPRGDRLIVGLDRHAGVFLFDTESGEQLWRKDLDCLAAFHPLLDLIAIQDADSISLLNAATGMETRQFKSGSAHARTRLAFTADGNWLASSDQAEFVHIHSLRTGLEEFRFQPHDWIIDLAFTRDDRLLTLGNSGKEQGRQAVLSIWDIPTRQKIGTLLGVPPAAREFSFHQPSGTVLMTGSPIKRWQVTTGTELKVLRSTVPDPRGLVFADEQRLIGPYRSSFLAQIDFTSNTTVPVPGNAYGRITRHPRSGELVMASMFDRGGSGRVAKFLAGTTLQTLLQTNSASGLLDIRHSQTGGQLIAVFRDSEPRILSHDTLQPITTLSAPNSMVRQAAFVDQDRHVVGIAGSRQTESRGDRLVHWRANDGLKLDSEQLDVTINSLATSADGSLLGVGGSDKTVRILRGSDLAQKSEFRAHDEAITAMAFHPHQPLVATAGDDLTIKIWNHETGRQVWQVIGPTRSPTRLVFSPSGRRLASTEQGSHVRVWELPDLKD